MKGQRQLPVKGKGVITGKEVEECGTPLRLLWRSGAGFRTEFCIRDRGHEGDCRGFLAPDEELHADPYGEAETKGGDVARPAKRGAK